MKESEHKVAQNEDMEVMKKTVDFADNLFHNTTKGISIFLSRTLQIYDLLFAGSLIGLFISKPN